MNNTSITIALIGVDERSKSAYQLFFENIKPVRYKLIDNYREAQLCLIDKDAYNSKQQYNELIQNYPDKFILSLSIIEQDCAHDKEFFLQKPIKREVLQKILNKICSLISGISTNENNTPSNTQIKQTVANISKKYLKKPEKFKQKERDKSITKTKQNTVVSKNKKSRAVIPNAGKLIKIENEEYFVGEHPDIDIHNPDQLKEVFYAPEKLLQSVMQQACEKSRQSGQVIQLNIFNHIFYFDAQAQKVHSVVGPAIIRPLCVVTHNDQAVFSVKSDSFRDDMNYILEASKNRGTNKANEKHSWSMEAFMWVITLWCSRGRVPMGTDITQPVYLGHWPNLTRLERIPHAVRISALIFDQPRSLIDTAIQLGIKQRYVFAYFSACHSIGLSDTSRRGVDKIFVSEKPEQHKYQSIMKKILGKLINNLDDTSLNEVANNADN